MTHELDADWLYGAIKVEHPTFCRTTLLILRLLIYLLTKNENNIDHYLSVNEPITQTVVTASGQSKRYKKRNS
jgi:hypothetical protein